MPPIPAQMDDDAHDRAMALIKQVEVIVASSVLNRLFIGDNMADRVVCPAIWGRLRVICGGCVAYTWLRGPSLQALTDPMAEDFARDSGFLFLGDILLMRGYNVVRAGRCIRDDLRDQGISSAGELVAFRRDRANRIGFVRAH